MSGLAERCDGCATITTDRKTVSLLVEGNLRAERDLCAACRAVTIDGFLTLSDGMVVRKVAL